MLHQKLLLGNDKYFLAVGDCCKFELHRHPEAELSFCLEGEYSVEVENEKITVSKGDLLLIKPMDAHLYPENYLPDSKRVTIELGPAFLGAHFPRFSSAGGVINLSGMENKALSELYEHLVCVAREYAEQREFCDLKIRSHLYAISVLVLEHFKKENINLSPSGKKKDIEKIERSLEIIYNSYKDTLNIDHVCKECGYSKSSFCRIFKRITGDTFHNILNRHRVEIACMLLEQAGDSVEEIATKVGFSDSKSFCRVFKSIMNESPGAYRKMRILGANNY